MIYRHMLQTASGKNITDNSLVVCVDLPGYGGSASFEKYGANEVLEALTEFVIGMRALYGSEDEETGTDLSKTYIVGHDWGCVLAYRLAAEAPALADRFILTNGPHIELALANKDRMLFSARKIFKQVSGPLEGKPAQTRGFHLLSKYKLMEHVVSTISSTEFRLSDENLPGPAASDQTIASIRLYCCVSAASFYG